MYNSQDVAQVISVAVKEQKTNINKMLIECSLDKNTLSNMKKGSMISADKLAKIADYLKCSVDFLLGREEKTNNVSDVDAEYMSLFNSLTDIDKGKILNRMELMLENYTPEQKENVS